MLKQIIGLVLVWTIVAGMPARAADPVSPDAAMDRLTFADGLLSRRLYDMAEMEYRGFIKDYPNHAQSDLALCRLGECLRALGRNQEAEPFFQQVLERFPKSPVRYRAAYQRADLMLEAGRVAEAADAFQALLKENPPADLLPAVRYFLAEAWFRIGRTAEALPLYETVRTAHPRTVQGGYAALRLGAVYGGTGGVTNVPPEPDRALTLYRSLTAQPPSDRIGAEAWFQLAQLLLGRRDFNGSAAAFKELLTKFPADVRAAEARLQAAWTSYHAKDYTGALGQADAALKTSGDEDAKTDDRAAWMYLKANCHRQMGKQEPARATYKELMERFPRAPFVNDARYERALCAYQAGQYEEAIRDAAGVQVRPEIRKSLYWLLAESHAALKQADGAIQFYGLIVKDFADSDVGPDAMYRLAHHLQLKGEKEDAARHFHELVERFPKHDLAPRALFASAECRTGTKHEALAIDDWGRLTRDYPAHALADEALYRKALIETRLVRDADAATTLADLMKRFPNSPFRPDALYWQGVLLRQTNELAGAVQSFRQALAAKPRVDLEPEIRFELAMTLHRMEQFVESANLFKILLVTPAKTRFTPALLKWQAEYMIGQKQYDAAVQAARILVESAPDAIWKQTGFGLEGRAQFEKGDKKAAELAFQSTLDLKVNTVFAAEAALRLADLRLAAGQWDAARDFYERAAASADSEDPAGIRPRAYMGLARIARTGGDDALASRFFLSVSVLYDDENLVPECLFEASEALQRQGRKDDSDRAFNELAERYPASAWAKKARTPATAVPKAAP